MVAARAVRPDRLVRGCSGLLAGGLVALLVLLIGAWVGSLASGTDGPGPVLLLGQLVLTVVAFALQRVTDRRGDRIGLLASLGVLLLAGGAVAIWLA